MRDLLEDRNQNIVARSLSENFPFVGESADWFNRAWEIGLMINGEEYRQYVIFENDEPFSYTIVSVHSDSPENDNLIRDWESAQFSENDEPEEIVKRLITISFKYTRPRNLPKWENK